MSRASLQKISSGQGPEPEPEHSERGFENSSEDEEEVPDPSEWFSKIPFIRPYASYPADARLRLLPDPTLPKKKYLRHGRSMEILIESAGTMREVIVHPTPHLRTTIGESTIPCPDDEELLIKVCVAGSNMKDWPHDSARNIPMSSGDDVAGQIVTMGKAAAQSAEFRKSDHVAGFQRMLTAGGSYAEYCVVPFNTAFKIPENICFEEAATIPLVACTAALSLFKRQGMPTPWHRRSSQAPAMPLIVFGADSALGTFAVKLAKAANIHPIIAIAGENSSCLHGILDGDKGDSLIDYRNGRKKMKKRVEKALRGEKCKHALDAFSSDGSWISVAEMVHPNGGMVSVVSGQYRYDEPEIPSEVKIIYTYVGTAHTGEYFPNMPKQPDKERDDVSSDPDFAKAFFNWTGYALSKEQFEGHPFEIIPGGLNGIETGLNRLKDGTAKGIKLVYQIIQPDEAGEDENNN